MISSENGLLIATVLMNVQGRDVGGFVSEARQTVARDVSLPAGYYVGWSGRWENQEHARQRLQVVLPVALVIIFVLLYFTYHSALEAAHVLLAVPFALTGGVYLLWLLGYNFSVAVWVGFIALFGTAVQTGVVMVIYLEESVARKRAAMGGSLTRSALREAVIDGALLRLRPKVMTVSTVIAGLLPIMWSTRVGAEVMKPLATPVLGGMVSSLVHVLIVTPVLFYWLQERRLSLQGEPPQPAAPLLTKRRLIICASAVAIIVITGALAQFWRSRDSVTSPAGSQVQQVRSGDFTILLLAPTGTVSQGRNTYTIEFRRADGSLVDVGTVRTSANMTMPGMAMSGGAEVSRTAVPGRYQATAEFGMAGAWKMAIEWDGPLGRGSIDFEGTVR
jgi:Cu(I)/Ag(I) efflux system membrane protein CusA/SilA